MIYNNFKIIKKLDKWEIEKVVVSVLIYNLKKIIKNRKMHFGMEGHRITQ